MRRDGFRRPDLLSPHIHGIDSMGDGIGLHDIGHGMDDVQVSLSEKCLFNACLFGIKRWKSDAFPALFSQHEGDHGSVIPDHTVIKKGWLNFYFRT